MILILICAFSIVKGSHNVYGNIYYNDSDVLIDPKDFTYQDSRDYETWISEITPKRIETIFSSDRGDTTWSIEISLEKLHFDWYEDNDILTQDVFDRYDDLWKKVQYPTLSTEFELLKVSDIDYKWAKDTVRRIEEMENRGETGSEYDYWEEYVARCKLYNSSPSAKKILQIGRAAESAVKQTIIESNNYLPYFCYASASIEGFEKLFEYNEEALYDNNGKPEESKCDILERIGKNYDKLSKLKNISHEQRIHFYLMTYTLMKNAINHHSDGVDDYYYEALFCYAEVCDHIAPYTWNPDLFYQKAYENYALIIEECPNKNTHVYKNAEISYENICQRFSNKNNSSNE